MSLRLEDVVYRYAGASKPALGIIDLELGPGDVLGVAGPSEAGKSTLCLVASGLAPVTVGGHLSGRVTVDGVDTATAAPYELAQRCTILFDRPQTQLSATERTAWEEVALGPRNLSLPLDEVVDRTWSALAALGITDLADRDPTHLSGGQMQLVALASVLAMRPAYLVLDEPTAQLDPAGTVLVATAVSHLASIGTGILMTEQKSDLLAHLATRLVVLSGGTVVREGATVDVLADERLEEWGVAPPSRVRLARALREAGIRAELPA